MGRVPDGGCIPCPEPQLCRQLCQHIELSKGFDSHVCACCSYRPFQVQIDPAMASELKKLQPTYNLSKGQTHSIPIGIDVCKFGLGWDTQCDLDASCIGLRADYSDAFICYFGNKDPIAGVVTSSGDNMSGIDM